VPLSSSLQRFFTLAHKLAFLAIQQASCTAP